MAAAPPSLSSRQAGPTLSVALLEPSCLTQRPAAAPICAAQRDCRARLAERGALCAEQRDFMFRWNAHLRRHHIHADADLPRACQSFAEAHASALAGDTPFRRCFAAHLGTLWRFRLLNPNAVHDALLVAQGGGGGGGG